MQKHWRRNAFSELTRKTICSQPREPDPTTMSLLREQGRNRKAIMIERISILGTGLLGTSVGLALRAAGFRGSITGWNRSAEQGQLALKMGAVDSLATDPIEAARANQVTVLAVPIFATLDWMEKLAP